MENTKIHSLESDQRNCQMFDLKKVVTQKALIKIMT